MPTRRPTRARSSISPRLVAELRHPHRGGEARERSTRGFTAVGAVGVDERAIVAVQARSPGYVEKLRVRAQYDSVAAGQPLVDLYVPDWLAAEEELLALKASAQPGAARSPTRRGSACACSACPRPRSRASSATASRRRA